jgi:energy-coupling factor transporter ATP-binding protein EcfA2
MAKRILIMGLPGSGKTTLSKALKAYLEDNSNFNTAPIGAIMDKELPDPYYKSSVEWFNADNVRKRFDDWDFSFEGRIRQSKRMRQLADKSKSDYVICDFVAPLSEMRENFSADWTIWVDTIDEGRYEDTNRAFVPPDNYDFRITEQNAEIWSSFVGEYILQDQKRPVFDWRKETVQMLGRWQPWHPGHRALFERALEKTGQVIIQIRDCQGWNDSNPFDFNQVANFIRKDLDPLYQGQYEIMLVPNIVNITYGRDVGYKIEQEVFDDNIHAISATNIRKQMGLK